MSMNEEMMKQMMPKNIYEFLKYLLLTLSGQAWVFMGLAPHPATGQSTTDLKQARLAIDSFEAVFNRLKEHVSPSEQQELANVLQSLQLQFVEKSKQ